ncbi:conserved hypothetical protein [Vibrio phage 150E35-1]|nr:conserved hypothetical protein [Vibrio phage 150E35-1]
MRKEDEILLMAGLGSLLGEVDGHTAQKVYHLLGDAGFDPSEFNASYNHASLARHEKKVADEAKSKELTHREKTLVKLMEVTKQDKCDNLYNNGNRTAIHWGRMIDLMEDKLGLRNIHDVNGSNSHESSLQRCEFNYFMGRNTKAFKGENSFTYDEWYYGKGKGDKTLHNPLRDQWIDEWRKISASDEYKSKLRNYRNFWHACIDGPLKTWRRDSVGTWSEKWFDLEKWLPCYWPYVMMIDKLTKHHPARKGGQVKFLIWW